MRGNESNSTWFFHAATDCGLAQLDHMVRARYITAHVKFERKHFAIFGLVDMEISDAMKKFLHISLFFFSVCLCSPQLPLCTHFAICWDFHRKQHKSARSRTPRDFIIIETFLKLLLNIFSLFLFLLRRLMTNTNCCVDLKHRRSV